MPLAPNERVERLRSIRGRLLNIQERRNAAATPSGAKKEMTEVVAELVIYIRLEYPEMGDMTALGGDP
jgi:hypothetical protein